MEGGDSSSPFALQTKPWFLSGGCMGGRVRGEEEGASKEFEFLERTRTPADFNDSLSSWLLHLPGEKCRPGGAVTGLERSGPEKIYRETEILTCTRGPKTALAIPARLVFLLRGVDLLWKYILFMKKARLDFPKNSLCSPRCGFVGCSRPSEDVERGARHCKASLSGRGTAKGSICQRCPSLFPLLNTFPAQSQTHCLSKGRTLVTQTPCGSLQGEGPALWSPSWDGGEGWRNVRREGKGERRARKKEEMWGRRGGKKVRRSMCVGEREDDHGGVRGSGVCSSTSGLSV